MKMRVAAIIPAFNEAETIAGVVETAMRSPLVDEVIVVSDGSTDCTAEAARQAGAQVFDLPTQSGKGSALRHGVTWTDAPIVLFLDADLRGLREEHLESLLSPVLSGSRQMNIGLRDRGKFSRFLGPRLPLISGERALLRTIFEMVPDEHLKGYMVEASLNFACRSHGLVYGSVFMSGVKIRTKFQKVGWKAFPQYARMWWQVLKAFWVVRLAYASGKVNELTSKVKRKEL